MAQLGHSSPRAAMIYQRLIIVWLQLDLRFPPRSGTWLAHSWLFGKYPRQDGDG